MRKVPPCSCCKAGLWFSIEARRELDELDSFDFRRVEPGDELGTLRLCVGEADTEPTPLFGPEVFDDTSFRTVVATAIEVDPNSFSACECVGDTDSHSVAVREWLLAADVVVTGCPVKVQGFGGDDVSSIEHFIFAVFQPNDE